MFPLMHGRDMEQIRPLSNDERLAVWASEYYACGHHHEAGFVVENEPETADEQ